LSVINGGWSVRQNEAGDLHVVPEGERHRCDDMCWCKPTLHEDEGCWVHHSFDRREEREIQ
jgi:hypothetical protein